MRPTALSRSLILALALTTSAIAADSDRYGKQKVIYHINDYGPTQQVMALRNIQNHIDAVGAGNVEVKVVLHGDGVSLLLEPEGLAGSKMKEANANEATAAQISNLKGQGVGFAVCANTLKGRNIDPAFLYDTDKEDIVPSGVAELSRLQGMGYTYIKP